jgi:colanic acid biosynthesis glycosyl transferase WcaI
MRIQLHDFAGHPFQADMSRQLAARGHEVVHAFSTQYVSGKGNLELKESDPSNLRFEGIVASRPFEKYSPVGRMQFERSYADAWLNVTRDHQPDVVVACNVPLFTLDRFTRAYSGSWLLWHQDLFHRAIAAEIDRKFPAPVASLGRRYVERIERRAVARSSGVVAIGEEFRKAYAEWGISRDVAIIPNWAPLSEIQPVDRENSWARHVDLGNTRRILYAGTLGRKHNPDLLRTLVEHVRAAGEDASLVIVSEGEGADQLKQSVSAKDVVLPFQPAEYLSDVLGAADVLVAVLEPDASQYSIPSKVLSYMAAGRPIVGLMPSGNPASGDIRETGGFVAAPDQEGVAAAADWIVNLFRSENDAREIGLRARGIAEKKFAPAGITDAFERSLEAATVKSGRGAP